MKLTSFEHLLDPENLQAALESALAGAIQKAAVAAVYAEGRIAVARCASDEAAEQPFPRIPLGCLTKLLTAELVIDAVTARRLELDEPVALPPFGRMRADAGPFTLRQLLEHMHGLDDSLLVRAPIDARKFIDAAALWRKLCDVPAIAPPGALYSYGNAGAWLAAAALEACTKKPFAELVRDLLSPCSARVPGIDSIGASPLCAALGGPLALAPPHLLELLRRRVLDAKRSWPSLSAPGTWGGLQPLAGWNPLERGVHLGWKAHGRGWFGHSSILPGAAAIVGAHPERRIAFAIATATHPPLVVAARTLGCALPELFDFRMPALVAPAPGAEARLVTGDYRSARYSLQVRVAGSDLRVSVADRRATEQWSPLPSALRSAANGIYYTDPPLPSFPYVQFLENRSGAVRYLWNGRFVLRKLP